jgi:hypothetical protein
VLRAFRAFRFGFFEVRVTLDGARESGNRIKVLELEKSPSSSDPCNRPIPSTGFLRLDPGFDAGGIEAVLVAAYQAGENLQDFPARPIAFGESHREGFLVSEAAQKRWPVYALERELA